MVGLVLLTFYAQLLPAQIPKVQKRQSTQAVFCGFLGSVGIKAARTLFDEIDLWCDSKPPTTFSQSRLNELISTNMSRL